MGRGEHHEHFVLEQIKGKLDESVQVIKEKEEHLNLLTQDLIEQLETLTGFFQIMYHHAEYLTKPEIEEFASRMDISVKNILLLAGNLIEWTAIQKGEIEIKPEEVNLNNAVNETIEFFKHISRKKDINITSIVDSKINVLADRNSLGYILRNLISNSIKYTTPGGNIDISANITGGMVEILISDDGVGMTGEAKQRILQENKPYTTRGTSNEKGNGYGLISSKKLIELNHGRLYIGSEPYQGTEVTVTLPLAD